MLCQNEVSPWNQSVFVPLTLEKARDVDMSLAPKQVVSLLPYCDFLVLNPGDERTEYMRRTYLTWLDGGLSSSVTFSRSLIAESYVAQTVCPVPWRRHEII